MVHEDTEEVPVPTGNGYGDQSHASDDIWYQAVLRMTQWAITLQEVHDERSRGKSFFNYLSQCQILKVFSSGNLLQMK